MLFLSYAEEDGKAGTEVAEWLRTHGFDVYHWQDVRHRGGLFIEQIEDAIARADAFIALLSPSFLASSWCRRERELAMQRELDLAASRPHATFIHVLKISDTPHGEAGFLRSYDWVDLTTPENRETALGGLAARLGQSAHAVMPEIADPDRPDPAKTDEEASSRFHGHQDDLNTVIQGLTGPAGPHFWLVTAPPGLGKSGFLRRLSAQLASRTPSGWVTRLIDLRDQPSDVRGSAGVLLTRLFGRPTTPDADPEALRDFAADISSSGRSWLCLLDSAELLDAATSAEVRRYLSQLQGYVQETGGTRIRLALVVASRHDDGWRGSTPVPRVARIQLSQLKSEVIRQELRDLAHQMGVAVDAAALREGARLVCELTAGLPVLVAQCLEWIRREGWLQVERLESQALFEELAEPYIQQRLLTPEGLGPGSRGQAGRPRYALEQAFRLLAPYRMFTMSHLRHHLEADAAFGSMLRDLGWSADDLWAAVSNAALLTRPLDEPWQEIHPAIRRLLFRYYYATDESQVRAHHEAREFTQVWADNQAGSEQVIGIVECLWHEAALLRLTRSAEMAETLSASADQLFRTLRPSAAYSMAELRAFAAERLRKDEEFQQAVVGVADLSATLTGIVVSPTLSGYVPRPEERAIRHEAILVRKDGRSRAVLLYGPGGAGKTWLVRQLALASDADQTTLWLDPVDLDDSESWLLSDLERRLAARLDPQNQYFGPYQEDLARLPGYARTELDYDTVASHLGRVKRSFVECYTNFVTDTGTTVVVTLDTIEAIRGTSLLLTLTQWMKALPGSLFIVAGRPPVTDEFDPVRAELESPYQGLPVTVLELGGFDQRAALAYLSTSLAGSLTDSEKTALVHLSQGHPLWLAFAIDYVASVGLPPEAAAPPDGIDFERDLPYQKAATPAGRILLEDFRRRLLAPYRETDFWHEAIKRLAVIRQGVSRTAWSALMDDRPLPDTVASLDEAWDELLRTPWIRPRANHRYMTLHDAVAEELAQRVIPLHDVDRTWRRSLWRRVIDIYTELIDRSQANLSRTLPALDDRLESLGQDLKQHGPNQVAEEDSALIDEISRLGALKGELNQLRSTRLYYVLLCDFAEGCGQFLELFEAARVQRDVTFQDLLASEMQRLLPGNAHPYALAEPIDEFREWLHADGSHMYLAVGLSMAQYLIANEQPVPAVDLLNRLPMHAADHHQRYSFHILHGNAYMRIPGRVKDGHAHLEQALLEATSLTSDDRSQLIAAAHRELGFYYRNVGRWREADTAYQEARDEISGLLALRSVTALREEMAAIYTNWANVRGLLGRYRDGLNLAESAIVIRRQLGLQQEEAASWIVCGEIYRYEQRYTRAWDAYSEAERLFQARRSWPGLGLLYQEQAICLVQALEDEIILTPERDPVELAKRLITMALDICRDVGLRAYPSALNRAGRIFGRDDYDSGLRFLADGADWGQRLSDGRFWFANLIEYAELSYRAWEQTGKSEYRDQITGREADITQATAEYDFSDLRGRWALLRSHLAVHDWLSTGDTNRLDAALEGYEVGFALLAQDYVGSSGAAAMPGEFAYFKSLVAQLPPDVREHWYAEFRRSWSAPSGGESTVLMARLEELY